jgi:hypothetical protein
VPLALAALLCGLPATTTAGSAAEPVPDRTPVPDDAVPGAPAPPDAPAPRVLAELRTLYQRIGAARQVYRATTKQLAAQERHVARLSRGLADTRTRLTESRRTAGQLAREEYRNGGVGFSPVARLLLGEDQDPMVTLHQQFVLDRAATTEAAALQALRRDERRSGELARRAQAALDTQQALAERQRRQQREVRRRVDAAERLLASLPAEELAELGQLERLEGPEAEQDREDPSAHQEPGEDEPAGGEPAEDEPAEDEPAEDAPSPPPDAADGQPAA